jgi:hypothetical protein
MIGHIETACFHYSGGCEMIFASNREAEWIRRTPDIRECYGKLFDKESGSSVVMLSPAKNGIILTISKMIPNRYGDNLTAYLYIPNALDISGEALQGIVFDVISSLAHNRRDAVGSCLSSISSSEYEQLSLVDFEQTATNSYAYRKVQSSTGSNSLSLVLNNLFQDYYLQYKYIFLAIDNQHIANPEQYKDLTGFPLKDWRPIEEKEMEQTSEADSSSNNEEDTNNNESVQPESQTVEITSEWLKANTEIHGWLSFFFFAIILGGLFSAIYPIATFNASDYAGNFCLGAVDIVTGLLLLAVAGFTVYSFVNRKPNAVFWGKVYVALVFLTNIFVLIGGATEDTGFQSTTHVIRGVIWGVIWFLYLSFSDQVQEVIPQSFRKITSTDWAMLAASVLLPVFLYVVGYSQINSLVDSRTTQEAEFRKTELSYNQRTDGRVIFTIPDGFECESQVVDVEGTSATLFSINNDEIGNCTMCSDYDTDKSIKNFDSYWEGWKDEDIKNYSTDNVDRGTKTINGNDCLYRITKHYVNGVYVYWRYYLLFDDETGKVFVASFYDTNNSTYYVDELLESVKFK